ncbi:MAG: prepilin-type N-terminal cleavage/methylation domain-containing protein [Myxococcales bacterium]|nr:prepilin-type N-terminal cleavage/methylation domain-containing protein [Myxococcales bacterium]
MTLIEVMVAMAILAILTTMIWGGFAQTAKNKERTEEIANRQNEIRMAIDRMQRELSMAFVSIHRTATPMGQTPMTAFYGKHRSGADRIDFTAFAHRRLFRNAKESDQCELSYFLARDPDASDQKVLVRREQNRIDDHPEKGGKLDVILHDVRELSFSYLDPQSGEWLETWDTTQATAQPNRLPTQIKIFVTVADPIDSKKDRVYGTRATLPITWGLNHAKYNP